MTKLFFAFLLVGFLGCAGTVGDDPANPGPSWGSDGGTGFNNNNDPGSDSMVVPPPDASQPTADADQPKPDADPAKCVKKNDGTCCLEGQACATPETKCKAGQKTIFRCNTDTCTTRVDCVDVDPPVCELKNGVCCLGDDCANTTVNVTCADGFEPGDLYCTKTCMPMRDCVEIKTDCVAQGNTCCVGQFCTSVENVCEAGETQEFVGCSTPNCIPVFDCT